MDASVTNPVTVSVTGSVPETALHIPLNAASVEKNLRKTGGTPFFCESVSCELDDGLMLSASALNALLS